MTIRSFIISLPVLLLSLFITGCCTCSERQNIEEARKLITNKEADCVLVKNGTIIANEKGHGLSPLLTVYETYGDQMNGAIVVDKVVGRAAAAIAINGNVRHVHGELMSEDAIEFLKEHGIPSSYTKLVPRILNQQLDGLCPLEMSVEGITDPAEALIALKEKIASMQK